MIGNFPYSLTFLCNLQKKFCLCIAISFVYAYCLTLCGHHAMFVQHPRRKFLHHCNMPCVSCLMCRSSILFIPFRPNLVYPEQEAIAHPLFPSSRALKSHQIDHILNTKRIVRNIKLNHMSY